MENVGMSTARKRAIVAAQRKAIEQVCGTQIMGQSIASNSRLVSDFILSMYRAQVRDWKIISGRPEQVRDDLGEWHTSYHVRLKAYVVCDDNKKDPSFRLHTELRRRNGEREQHRFVEGDAIELRVRATQDCYLTILCVTEEDSMHVIFPNRVERNRFLEGGKTRRIPDPNAGYEIILDIRDGSLETEEAFIVVATKRDQTLINMAWWKKPEGYGPLVARSEFVDWLMAIDRSDREMSIEGYKIYSIHSLPE